MKARSHVNSTERDEPPVPPAVASLTLASERRSGMVETDETERLRQALHAAYEAFTTAGSTEAELERGARLQRVLSDFLARLGESEEEARERGRANLAKLGERLGKDAEAIAAERAAK